MTNSTTPDSPKQCPTCGSDLKPPYPCEQCTRNRLKVVVDDIEAKHKAHTSLPTASTQQATTTTGTYANTVKNFTAHPVTTDPSETRAGERLPISSCCSAPIAEDDGYGFCTKCNQRLYARVGEQEGKKKEETNMGDWAEQALPKDHPARHRSRSPNSAPVQTGGGSTPTLEPWMTREAFEWMDAALGLDAELYPYLTDLIPSKEELCGVERERWQKVVNVIFRSADHADAMPQSLQCRAPRKGPHSLKLRRTI